MTAGMEATAVVLCGGQTRRFGGEKAHALVDGRRVIDRVVEAVRPLAGRVVLVASAEKTGLAVPDDVVVVPDAYPGSGPLGGICTGLQQVPSDLAVVVGCDLPFLSEGLLRFLLDRAEGFDAVVPRLADGRWQTLHAVYARTCLGEMERQLAAGRLSVWRVLERLHVGRVGAEECRAIDPDLLSFFNLNTPEDLARANRIAAGEGEVRPGAVPGRP